MTVRPADLKRRLVQALAEAARSLGAEAAPADVVIQEVPADKSGDYGTPLAFSLAKSLRKNPATIAQELVARLELPPLVTHAEAAGPYLNFHLDRAAFVESVVAAGTSLTAKNQKVVIEHTSINPNKEAHVGHLRNIVLGDACARLLRAAGYEVEVQNYIDDTGRQAAESIFAMTYFGETYDPKGDGHGKKKYDHWLGELYVRLNRAKETDGERIERGVSEVMHRLEQGELRDQIESAVRALLQTSYKLGAEYDLLVWESDIVRSGFLAQALAVLKNSELVFTPEKGKFAGALVMDVSSFLPGLEEPLVVLVRSDGNAMYVAKDIGTQFWKVGLFTGLTFVPFDTQPSGKVLYSSAQGGDEHPDGRSFAGGDRVINVIDVRQSHPQTIVKTALALTDSGKGFDASHHLVYEVVTLEGQAMSGRKGITLSIDEVIDEAVRRARAVVEEKNPSLAGNGSGGAGAGIDEVARMVGVGALRFGMLRSEARRIIDFRWEQALSLQGDSAPYLQYAHARACSILRAAAAAGVGEEGADWTQVGELELSLAKAIAAQAEIIERAAADLAPHTLAQYALELAALWNGYYNHKDAAGRPDTQVLRAEPGLREARLALVRRTRDALAYSLEILGIGAPQEM